MAPRPSHEPAELGAVPAELTLVARAHVATRRNGLFAATHPYVEECWCSVLGPTSVLLLRRAALLFCERVPAVVDAADLAASLGLGRGLGRNHPLGRTIERLRQFRLVAWEPGPALAVTQLLPALSRSQLARVPEWVRGRHAVHLEALGHGDPAPPTPAIGSEQPVERERPILGSATGTAWQHRPDRPRWHPEDCNGSCCWRRPPAGLLRRRADGAVGGPQTSPGGPGGPWWAGWREPGPGRSL